MTTADTLQFSGKRRGSRRVAAYALLFCFGTCLVLFTLWRSWLDAPPTLRVPAASLPSPNAHDLWLEAAGRLTLDDGKRISAAVPDGLYPSAAGDPPVEFTLAEKETLLRQHRAVIARVREGLRHAYLAPSLHSETHNFDYLKQFRTLSRLLRLEAEVQAKRGNYVDALSASLAALEMAVVMPRGNAFIGQLYGAQDQAAARALAWKIVSQLPVTRARAGADRMEQIRKMQFPFWRSQEEEKWLGQASLLAMMRHRKWRWALQELVIRSPTSLPRTGGELLLVLKIQSEGKAQILSEHAAAMDRIINQARRTRWASGGLIRPSDPLIDRLVPTLNTAWLAVVKSEAQNDLLYLGLAIQAYRAERGSYPEKLEGLVPGYLARLPEDPFAPGSPFRYRRKGATFLLYSAGPDGRDDGGLPATSRLRARSPRGGVPYEITADSRGDLVAGKNLW